MSSKWWLLIFVAGYLHAHEQKEGDPGFYRDLCRGYNTLQGIMPKAGLKGAEDSQMLAIDNFKL
jgi:hypothetical protein